MKVRKPPLGFTPWSHDRPILFAAGSIEMGAAEDWQDRLAHDLRFARGTLLNPRRDDWDSSWVQSIENEQFRRQVDWELDGLRCADVVALYLSPGTVSPISLLELGLYAESKKLVVFCPEGYARKGNVDIVCRRFGVTAASSWDDWLTQLYERLLTCSPLINRSSQPGPAAKASPGAFSSR